MSGGAKDGLWSDMVEVNASLDITEAESASDIKVTVDFELDARGPTETEIAIMKQIEFYFSEGNLRRDLFLREHIQANQGWALIATIADFGKVKQLTMDLSVVATALSMSKLLEVNSTYTMMRGIAAEDLPEYAETLPRTVCVEDLRIATTVEMVEDMMKQFGHPVNYVQIPQDAVTGHTLGFAFVEYATTEIAEEVVALAAKQAESSKSARSWRGAKDVVKAIMKSEWEAKRKKGKNKERKQDRKAKQDAKAEARKEASSPRSADGADQSLDKTPEKTDKTEKTEKKKKKKEKKEKKVGSTSGGSSGGESSPLSRSPKTSPHCSPVLTAMEGPAIVDGAVSIADEDDEWWKNKGKKEKKKFDTSGFTGEARPARLKLLPRSRASTVGGAPVAVASGEGRMAKGPETGNIGFGAGRGKRIPTPAMPLSINANEFKPGMSSSIGSNSGIPGAPPSMLSNTPPNVFAPAFEPQAGMSTSLPTMSFN